MIADLLLLILNLFLFILLILNLFLLLF